MDQVLAGMPAPARAPSAAAASRCEEAPDLWAEVERLKKK